VPFQLFSSFRPIVPPQVVEASGVANRALRLKSELSVFVTVRPEVVVAPPLPLSPRPSRSR